MGLFKNVRDSLYEWAQYHLPFRLMYVKINVAGGSLWWPRWGFTKRQLDKAKKDADERFKNLKFD